MAYNPQDDFAQWKDMQEGYIRTNAIATGKPSENIYVTAPLAQRTNRRFVYKPEYIDVKYLPRDAQYLSGDAATQKAMQSIGKPDRFYNRFMSNDKEPYISHQNLFEKLSSRHTT